MKKAILGSTFQIIGFLGAVIILVFASQQPWDYNGFTGLIGSLLGTQLIYPCIACAAVFVIGLIVSLADLSAKD